MATEEVFILKSISFKLMATILTGRKEGRFFHIYLTYKPIMFLSFAQNIAEGI